MINKEELFIMIDFQRRLTRGIQSALDKTSIEDGKLRFTTDTGRLFLDNGLDRVEITDFVKGKTEEEIRDIIAPLPKFYFASDTKAILIYDGDDWVKCCDRVSYANTATNASTADYSKNAATATYATNSGTSTYSTNAGTTSYAENAGTASYAENANNASTANYSKNAGTAINASTADYATNAGTASYVENASTANYAENANSANTATNASTADYAKNATNASTAEYSKNADTASYSKNSGTSVYATNAGTASYSTNSGTALYANNAGNATNASTANYGTNAGTANYAKSASSATNADKALNDINGNQINTTYAPLVSPIFSGIPSVPTPTTGSNDTQIANTEFVTRAIASALSSGLLSFEIVDDYKSLPETGANSTIYMVPNNNGESGNYYDEYVWINETYEKIGTTQIDLSGYFNSIEVSGTGNAVTNVTKADYDTAHLSAIVV